MLLRKMLRTAFRYKAQFISMIVMVAIGIGVFVGFNMEWYSLRVDTNRFFEQTKYADYRLMNEKGFGDEDIAAIKDFDGVQAATRVLSVNADTGDRNKSLALFVSEEYTVSTMLVTSGKEYDENSDGFWLSDKYAAANDIRLGDTLSVKYRNAVISGEVAGLCKSGEFMICTPSSNQLMPDYAAYGFVYASPEKIKNALGGVAFYPQIHIRSNMKKTALEKAVRDALGRTTLVLGKAEHRPYSGAQSEIEEGQTMGSVLPVLFLLIGILTMITTMHRITANEKTQIGTLKALGFKNRRILAHYTSYGLFIGVLGSLLGIGLGVGICSIIIHPTRMMGTLIDMPDWEMRAPWQIWLLLAGVLAFLTLISFLSVKKMLRGTAAEALRPYTPKKGKPLKLEKTKAWDKMKFSVKWNLRDIFRHKARTLMSLVGVFGCMVLLVGGLGMEDTMTDFLDTLDKKVLCYETRVDFAETVTNEQAAAYAQRHDGDYVASMRVQVNGTPVALEAYHVPHDYIRFIDKNNKRVALTDAGAYISLRVADRGYKTGDTIEVSPYGSDKTYAMKVVGVLRSTLSECISVTTEYAQSIGLPYTVTAAFVDKDAAAIETAEFVSSTQSKANVMDSYNAFMDVINVMVLLLVLAAVLLGVVVLYNLGVMSYTERKYELATLKVVGFRNRQIGRILIEQNIWLTIAGILVGLPAGAGILYLLIALLAREYELKMTIGALTYCVSILLTFGVSMLVSLFVARKNKKINMTEALKGGE